jgi:hypothetical protein
MSSELETQLLATAGFKSLDSERHLVALARSLDWDTVHSFYYRDPNTGKSRELDILEFRSYVLVPKKINPLVRVSMLMECKTIENYNLVFSLENPSPSLSAMGYFDWIGEEDARNELFVRMNDRLSADMVSMLMKEFDSIAYPQGRFLASPLMIDPPRAVYLATAFRELKPKSERDLDASVLWKSVQSLSGALRDLQSRSVNSMFDYILADLEGLDPNDNLELLEHSLSWCHILLTTINIYHPIIVVQCPMLGWDGKKLTKVNHVRLLSRMHGGQSHWYDVVQIEGMPGLLNLLTKHYDRLVPEGLERLRPHLKLKRGMKRRPSA